jgi:excisionase family DNA binding protein
MPESQVLDDERLLTVDEACEFLKLSRPKVYHLLRKGKIPNVAIDDTAARRISRQALIEYCRARQVYGIEKRERDA